MLDRGLAEVIRRLVIAAMVAAAAVAALVMTAASPGGGKTYRVDAIFDNAGFVIPGQDVKIAGAKVGKVVGLHVTRDKKARIEMQIDAGFAPFRSDADCIVRPQSLIGEKFVDCTPGTVKGKPLAAKGGYPPTVPVTNTHSPVDLDLVFDALRMPVRQRLALVVDELGTGLAGRPTELNATILRANPALQQTRRVLAILDADRSTLGRLIDGSDRVLAALNSRREDVGGFIDHANQVAQEVASRRGDLGTAIDRLPPMLAQLEPTAKELAGLVREGRPVVDDLRPAARPLDQLLGDFEPLAGAGRPALAKVDQLSRTGRRTVAAAMPVAQLLKPISHDLVPISKLSADLNDSLEAKGVVEGILKFLYYGTAATARFDQFSHILPSYQIAGQCQQYATKPAPGCSAHFNDPPATAKAGTTAKADAKSKARSAALDYLLGK